jgi:hypothetical protein
MVLRFDKPTPAAVLAEAGVLSQTIELELDY